MACVYQKILRIFDAVKHQKPSSMLNKNASARLQKLAATLTSVAGVEIEITIRAIGEFTVSAEGNAIAAIEKVKVYFGSNANWEAVEYDEECDFTCGYFAAK